MGYFNYKRRESSEVRIGNTMMGGKNPIRIQSMANVSTMDTIASIEQAIKIFDAGGEYVRFTAQGEREARNLGAIRAGLNAKGYKAPLIADIHFNPKAADVAACEIEKVRINPGNYVDKVKRFNHIEYTDEEYSQELEKIRERLVPFLNICKEHQTAIRIGVNHGSLSDRIMSRYGDTPEGMVASCMEFLHICRDENFNDVVISIKASNTVVMVETVRLLVREMDANDMHYPLHLGVTEAGEGEDGRIKSAVGIGALLADGIGDTIRVSLTEDPEKEIPVAKKLVDYVGERMNHEPIEAEMCRDYNPIKILHRKSTQVESVGGFTHPIVISDRSNGDFEFNPSELQPDFVYFGEKDFSRLSDSIRCIVDFPFWKEKSNVYPCFSVSQLDALSKCSCCIKFVSLLDSEVTDAIIETVKRNSSVVLILNSNHQNYVGAMRAVLHRLMIAQCDVPVVLHKTLSEDEMEDLQIKSGADLGALLLDGFGDGLMLTNLSKTLSNVERVSFGILQAARLRFTKTEYISCPSCGRTLYDLQTTIARIKEATKQLKGLKIGIMGCIVNGPGEMADADYGYVGSGRHQICLYKGKECVMRNIPEDEAVDKLVQLIKDNGDWID